MFKIGTRLKRLVRTVSDETISNVVVHKHGILQFINVYKMYYKRCCAELRWGDEVDAIVILFT